MRLACLLMAAGAGTRFGGCKQLAEVDGRPMIQHGLLALSPLFGDDLFTVLGAYREKIAPQVAALSQVVEHPGWQAGLGSSIAQGVRTLQRFADYQGVLIALADQPGLHSKDYQQLLDCFDGSLITAAEYGDRPGVPAVFPSAFFPLLERLDGDRGAQSILIDAGDRITTLALPAARSDIDRPEDLETA